MVDQQRERDRRKGVRLHSKESLAGAFECPTCAKLPPQATIGDVSEGGVQLLFDWPAGAEFPLRLGDGMGFRLKIEGGERDFEVWSLVRRIAPADDRGRVGVGVEFTGLEPAALAEIRKTLLSMATARLRTWRLEEPAEDGAGAAGAAEAAASQAAGTGGARRRLFLGEILVKQGALDSARFGRFLATEFTGDRPLGQELLEKGLTTEAAIARALAEQARLPYVEPEGVEPDLKLAANLPRPIFIEHPCVPLREEDGAVVLAMSAPPGVKELDALRQGLGRRVRVCIVPEQALARWRKEVYNALESSSHAGMRFPAQLRIEYRFVDAHRQAAIDRQASFGLTREISADGLLLAGQLPKGVTPERVSAEGLLLDLFVDCPSLAKPLNLHCTPLKIEPGAANEEHLVSCRIDAFPNDGEGGLKWARVCMVHGTHRFRPQSRTS